MLISLDTNYVQETCWRCKGKGWLELFNHAEYQGQTGFVPATRWNANVIACPVCGGQQMTTEKAPDAARQE